MKDEEIDKVCSKVKNILNEWVFSVETQCGEKLKVVDSSDFEEILQELKNELKQ